MTDPSGNIQRIDRHPKFKDIVVYGLLVFFCLGTPATGARATDDAGVNAPQVREAPKKGFVGDIETLTQKNSDYRHVLYTAKKLQLVLMSIMPHDEIGEEMHGKTDQFFRIENGEGEIWINGLRTRVKAGDAIIVPSGAKHNFVNTGKEPLQLYTIYSPPMHRDGLVRATKAEAEQHPEKFNGRTTEGDL